MSEIKSALLSLTEVFRAPLEAKGVDLSSILDVVENIVDYSLDQKNLVPATIGLCEVGSMLDHSSRTRIC